VEVAAFVGSYERVLDMDVETFDALARHMTYLRQHGRYESFWLAWSAHNIAKQRDANQFARGLLPKEAEESGSQRNDVAKFMAQFGGGI
jgi:hypothetical protein